MCLSVSSCPFRFSDAPKSAEPVKKPEPAKKEVKGKVPAKVEPKKPEVKKETEAKEE